jgi:hypothetical protein
MIDDRIPGIIRVLVAFVVLILLTACSGGGGGSPTPTAGFVSADTPEFTATALPPLTVTPPAEVSTGFVGDLGWGTVSGTILDAGTGEPIAGATVTCTHVSYTSPVRCSGTTTSDAAGRFSFEGVFFHDTDQLTLNVSAPGYNSQAFSKNFFTQPGMEVEISLTAATATPVICCTPPPCKSDETYYCPGECPCGCGTTCATHTPTP